MKTSNRRRFLRDLGLSSAALPFLSGLPGLQGKEESKAKQRLVVMFMSASGVLLGVSPPFTSLLELASTQWLLQIQS